MELKEMIDMLKLPDDKVCLVINRTTAAMVADRLEELERTNNDRSCEWHSVKDDPPKEKGNYFAYNEKNDRVYILPADGEIVPWSSTFGITHWMPLPEPPKPKEPTFKDVFLEKFPKVQIDERGIPRITCCTVFPYLNDGRNICQRFKYCYECWNQPYFEAEEGEADA